MEAIKQGQRNVAKIIAICVFILGLGILASQSKGIFHYWIDESPGPTYVMYDRTLLELVGVSAICLTTICILTLFVWAAFSPS